MAGANYATDQLFVPGTRVSVLERTFDSHLCEAAIDKQFRSRHEATFIRCEKPHGLRDLFGFAEPATGTALEIIFKRCRPVSEEPSSSFSPGVSIKPGLTAFSRMRRTIGARIKCLSRLSSQSVQVCATCGNQRRVLLLDSARRRQKSPPPLALPSGDILKYLLGILAGDDGIVQPNVLAFVLVNAGVVEAGILITLELIDGVVHQSTVEQS